MIKVKITTMLNNIYYDTADIPFTDYFKKVMKESDAFLCAEDIDSQITIIRVNRIESITLVEGNTYG